MIKYQYQVVRYVHDQFTGEFANIGIVIYCPDQNILSCKVINRYSRLSGFFINVNGNFLLQSLRHLAKQVNFIGKDVNAFLEERKFPKQITSITKYLLPKDDSSLIFADSIHGLDINITRALEDLFQRIIDKYNSETVDERNSDAYAWRKVYKNYFDKYGLTNKLKKHTVQTKKDNIPFDKAWKNGVWNCYQSLSLDLKKDDTIKNKVYKWSGIVRELETSDEPLHVYFLTTSPKEEHARLQAFIEDKLSIENERLKVTVVTEDEAEEFAAKVRTDMEKSDVFEDPF